MTQKELDEKLMQILSVAKANELEDEELEVVEVNSFITPSFSVQQEFKRAGYSVPVKELSREEAIARLNSLFAK